MEKTNPIKTYNRIFTSISDVRIDRLKCPTERSILYHSKKIKPFKYADFPTAGKLQKIMNVYLQSLERPSASPKAKKLFEEIYVYPDHDFLLELGIDFDYEIHKQKLRDFNTKEVYANINPKATDCLVSYLIETAISCRKARTDDNPFARKIMKESVHFLVGDPGIGKTTFINMLLSVYTQQFSEDKVIPIRIDLNKYYYRASEFTESFLIKTMQILRDKYFEKIDFGSDAFRGYIAQKWGISEGHKGKLSLSDLDGMFTKFFTLRLYDIENQLDVSFMDAIIDYLMEREEYSFIFIIDGLDRVTLNQVNENKFKEGCENVMKIITFKYFKNAMYIISMRNTSFLDALTSFEDKEVWRYPKRLFMLPVAALGIWEERMRYAECEAETFSQNDKELSWVNKDVISILTKGINLLIANSILKERNYYLEDEELERLKINAFKKLERISSGNYRALMKCLRVMFLRIFDIYDNSFEQLVDEAIQKSFSSFGGKEYLIRRILYHEREESNNYRVPYTYSVVRNKIEFKRNQVFVALVPNVFNFIDKYYPLAEEPMESSKQEYRILVKIRILQLLKKETSLKKFQLIKKIASLFGYSEFFIRYEFEEMIHFQFIKPIYKVDLLNEDDYPVEITSLGEEIIDNFIFDFSYYSFLVDDTPIPFHLIKYFEPINNHWASVSIDRFAAVKIKCVIYFLCILTEIEKIEEKYYSTYSNETNSFRANGYRIVPKITAKVSKEIHLILRDRMEESENFLDILSEVFRLEPSLLKGEQPNILAEREKL